MRKWLLSFCLLAFFSQAFSQREIDEGSKPSFKDRVYFGGGLGLNGGRDAYGNSYFYIGLYPIIGYMVNNQFSVGIGITFQHYNYPDFDLSINQYGFSPFARYNFGNLFLYTEYMILNSATFINAQRQTYDRLLFGIGYSQPLGKRSSINVMGMYDVIWKRSDGAFASPFVFRVFFSF